MAEIVEDLGKLNDLSRASTRGGLKMNMEKTKFNTFAKCRIVRRLPSKFIYIFSSKVLQCLKSSTSVCCLVTTSSTKMWPLTTGFSRRLKVNHRTMERVGGSLRDWVKNEEIRKIINRNDIPI